MFKIDKDDIEILKDYSYPFLEKYGVKEYKESFNKAEETISYDLLK